MVDVLYWISLVGCLAVAALVMTFLIETTAAIALPRKTFARSTSSEPRDRVGVLIPAHLGGRGGAPTRFRLSTLRDRSDLSPPPEGRSLRPTQRHLGM